ncbi:MAG: hypothetical protein UC703_00670 [Bacilli bacterium]|jgi:hypothetical protein|nr:hypothetical protein [Bacilli bacterium]
MDNFMFQKLMSSKEKEEENQKKEEQSVLENSGVEVLSREEKPITASIEDTTKEETDQEGYTARKNN